MAQSKESTVSNILHNDVGAIIISVVLGLGLAAIFRATCHGESCIVVKGPPHDHIRQNVYKIDQHCYKYSSYAVPCPEDEAKRAELTLE